MTRRILLAGGPAQLRQRLAAELDSAFDVVIEESEGPLEALGRLPSSDWDLFVVLPEGGRAPGLDLVRALSEHALHGSAPVLFVSDDEGERLAALAAGAERALGCDVSSRSLAGVAAELLGLG